MSTNAHPPAAAAGTSSPSPPPSPQGSRPHSPHDRTDHQSTAAAAAARRLNSASMHAGLSAAAGTAAESTLAGHLARDDPSLSDPLYDPKSRAQQHSRAVTSGADPFPVVAVVVDDAAPGASRREGQPATGAESGPAGPGGGGASVISGHRNAKPAWMDIPRAIWNALCRHWFLIGVILSILLGWLIPEVGKNGGPIHAEYTIKYGAVMVVFFLSGLGLKGTVLKQAFAHWRAHLVIQTLSFGLVPLLGFLVAKLLTSLELNDALAAGLVVALCMPTTISSNVIMTDAAKGNEAVSLINATLGNIAGIVISPLLLLLYLGARTTIDFVRIFIDIPVTVVGPLALGQVIRVFAPHWVAAMAKRLNFSTISSCMLLLLIYASFADNFARGTLNVSLGAVAAMIGTVWVFYPLVMAMCLGVGLGFKFARPDVVSIVYCGSTKTLSMGIPLIGIIYRNDPNNGLYALPLLVYHASQLFIGGWAVPWLREWVKAGAAEQQGSQTQEDAQGMMPGRALAVGDDESEVTVPAGSARGLVGGGQGEMLMMSPTGSNRGSPKDEMAPTSWDKSMGGQQALQGDENDGSLEDLLPLPVTHGGPSLSSLSNGKGKHQ